MLLCVGVSLALWFVVFASSSAIAGAASKGLGRATVAGAVSQLCFAGLSLLVWSAAGAELSALSRLPDAALAAEAVLASLVVGFLAAFLTYKAQKGAEFEPPFAPKNAAEMVVMGLVLAPVGEEMLFRGLLESYLLACAPALLAIFLPAVLFALIHLVPFRKAPRTVRSCVVAAAFVLGLMAGYYRAAFGSLLLAVLVHATFNGAGIVLRSLAPKA